MEDMLHVPVELTDDEFDAVSAGTCCGCGGQTGLVNVNDTLNNNNILNGNDVNVAVGVGSVIIQRA